MARLPISTLALAMVSAALAQQPLPSAPSSVLAEQQAGSGFVYKAAGSQPGPAETVLETPTATPLRLTLDDAIALGLDRNARLAYDLQNESAVRGYNLSVIAAVLPTVTASAKATAQEINLQANGFKASTFAGLVKSGKVPPGFSIPLITKVNTLDARVSVNQTLFNLTDFEVLRAIKSEASSLHYTTLSDRGEVIQQVATVYLRTLADAATLANDRAQLHDSETVLDQATEKLKAGVGVKIDKLRAQVDLQQRQQTVRNDEAVIAKDVITLDRILGLPAGQQIEFVDTLPVTEIAADSPQLDLSVARDTAYARRKDYLSLLDQVAVAEREVRGVRFQRLPSLNFSGYYGVIGVPGDLYHGNFDAQAQLAVPLFREAAQRGEEDVVTAQLRQLRDRTASLRGDIDYQLRTAMMDVSSDAELVHVARANLELAQQQLSDERERFKAGIDDNLPVVDAETTLTSAQAQLVRALYQYNLDKLALARATGVIESRYRTYLNN